MKPTMLRASQVRRLIPHRPLQSHKGQNGHVLIWAGSSGMTGAAYLCALGALKTGAGLVTVAGVPAVQKIIQHRLPEAMTILPGEIAGYVRRRTITTLAIGPGLTVSPVLRKRIKALLALGIPAILDADGLNNLVPTDLRGHRVIVTPHPGEFAKLTGQHVTPSEAGRLSKASAFARRSNVICVLKGHRTIIASAQALFTNTTGNTAMATGGMGDVLTGIIAAFHAQGLSLLNAACAGVYIHGLAADITASADRGSLASEVALAVPRALKRIGL